MSLLQFVISYFTHFIPRPRQTPPKCLNDPINGTHGYLSLENIKIHYVEKGDRSKPLMLFLHGFPEFWYSWRYQMKEFSKNYWTVAVDMRGFGDSDKPSSRRNYTMEILVNDIKQIVEALGSEKCILVGHDWGGIIAWKFADMYPQMLESYIILNAPYLPSFFKVLYANWKQCLQSWYVIFIQLPFLPEIFFRPYVISSFLRLFRGKSTKSLSHITSEDIEAYKYTYEKPGAFTPPFGYYRANILQLISVTDNVKQKLEVPGLIIYGEHDDYLVPEITTVAQKEVNNLQVKIVKDASHFVQQCDPETVNNIIKQFLQK